MHDKKKRLSHIARAPHAFENGRALLGEGANIYALLGKYAECSGGMSPLFMLAGAFHDLDTMKFINITSVLCFAVAIEAHNDDTNVNHT